MNQLHVCTEFECKNTLHKEKILFPLYVNKIWSKFCDKVVTNVTKKNFYSNVFQGKLFERYSQNSNNNSQLNGLPLYKHNMIWPPSWNK